MDLHKIPNDTGGDWRIDQFVKLYINYPDDSAPILTDLCSELSNDEKMWLLYLFSVCYNVPTALFMSKKLSYTSTEQELEEFWKEHKWNLVFTSDRRWVKARDEFVFTVYDFIKRVNGHPYDYVMSFITDDPVQNYTNLNNEIGSWNDFGPFGVSLFLRMTMIVLGLNVKVKDFDWKDGHQSLTVRECMYLMNYEDEKADETRKLRKADKKAFLSNNLTDDDVKIFNETIDKIVKKIHDIDPNIHYEFNEGLSMLCFYRKMYKNMRYFGYYLDRGLTELLHMEECYPEEMELWQKIRASRKKNYNNNLLGELHGWKKIRNNLNDHFTKTGDVLTDIELPTTDDEDW